MTYTPTDLKVGDIITAYHKGYWRITKIERRFLTASDLRFGVYIDNKVGDEYSPLIHMELVADVRLKRPVKKARKECCDAMYCHKFTKQIIEEEKQKLINFIEQLDQLAIDVSLSE